MESPSDWPSTRASLLAELHDRTDSPSWRLFVEIYEPLIQRYCRRRGLQDADARDVTQDVMLDVRRAIPTFDYDRARGRFRGWLGMVTSRRISKHLGSARRAGLASGTVTSGDGLLSEADASWIVEFNSHLCDLAHARIRPGFEALTWQAFEWLWSEHVPPDEVARRLQRSVKWVYQVKFRVLKRLREEVLYLAADSPTFFRD
ncbi:MAG TPA: sigma-70 family RNA polymerase sigma factor [Planctomycetaceae bacterium]|nr:sigma-70 family RNA polymerase sigma factor [Planctomycetaceae bacterium]